MSCLRVCIVGGIFDLAESYQVMRRHAIEVVLAEGLRSHGVEVETIGHHHFIPFENYEIVHVHHLGIAALVMATSNVSAHFVYTSHDPKIASGYQVSRRRVLGTRFVASRADALVTLSEPEKDIMRSLFPDSSQKLVTIPNGQPSQVFFYDPEAERGPRDGKPYKLIFVGQLIPQKGLHVLLEAVAQVGPRWNVELYLAYHNDQMEGHYRDLADRLSIADRVRFLGFKTGRELVELYRSADILVLPSFAEAMPAVISEGMMCGLPVVATNIAAIPDQVGPYGYLVRPGSVPELAGAIDRALGAIATHGAPSAEISRYATERFSIAAMVEAHLAL